MCGDIHPNPGLLRTAVANVTSLCLHAAEVASWEVDGIFPQETKLSGGGGGGAGERPCATFCQKGVAVFLGLPTGYQGGGYVEHPLGRGPGPGVRGRHRGAGEAPPQARVGPPGVGPLGSTRWVHVRVALGDGATLLHAVSVYGVVGHRKSNSALWEDMLHHLSSLGNAPHIVGADYNFPLAQLRDVPQAMLAHLLTRRLVDLNLESAGSKERCRCGYTRGEEVAATRIDGVLADLCTASTVLRVERIPSKGIPGHRPVCFDLAVEAASQEVLRAIQPPQIVLPEREPDL